MALSDLELKFMPILLAVDPKGGTPSKDNKIRLAQNVWASDGVYVKRVKDTDVAISNFTIQPVKRIVGADSSSMELNIVPQTGKAVESTISMDILTSVAKFTRALANLDPVLRFQGNRNDLGEIRQLVGSQAHPISKQVDFAGIHRSQDGSWTFVTHEGAIKANGDSCDEFVVNPDKALDCTTLHAKQPIETSELQALLYPLFHFNALPITAAIMGYIGACFLQEPLKSIGVKLGCLVMTGEGGSGKSKTLETLIQPIFGLAQAVSASGLTEATLRDAISSCNTFPLIVEEYKEDKLTKAEIDMICNALRSSYDEHLAMRHCGSGIERIPIRRPLIVSGESSPTEPAIRERSVHLVFSKDELGQHPEYGDNMRFLAQKREQLSQLGISLLRTAMDLDLGSLQEGYSAFSESLKAISPQWPDRIRDNFTNAVMGLALLLKLCEQENLSLTESIQCSQEGLIDALQTSFRQYLLDGSEHSMSVIDSAMVILFCQMNLVYGKDFKYPRNKANAAAKSEIALNLDRVYASYMNQARKQRLEVLNQTQFEAQLKGKSYYIDERPVRMGGNVQRMFILDVQKLEALIRCSLPSAKRTTKKA